jgi:hypothetical protein
VNNFLKQRLSLESSSIVRHDIQRLLLSEYNTPNDYQFVKEFSESETDTTIATRVVKIYMNHFFVRKPDSTVSISVLFDTLTSYTNQSYDFEWLKDETYKTELLSKITNAKNYLNSEDSTNCAIEIKIFQNRVNEVYSDSSGSYPKYVNNEGYKFLYYYSQYILDRLPTQFPKNDITAKLKTKVLKKSNGNLKYEFKVKNKGQSSQDIGLFYVKEKTNKVKLNSPAGWITGELAESSLISFSADSEGVEIKPGDWQKGFSVKAKRLPHITNYYIQSSRIVVDTTDIYNNSYTGLTLSPALTPTPFAALEFTDTLISYKNQAYDLGWIKKEKVYNNFSKKLNKAKSKLENNKERKAKEILREFVQIVRKKWRNKKISGEALALLKFNAQYLKQHIGPPDLEDNLAGVTLEGVERMSGKQRRYKYTVHNSVNNPHKLWAFYVKESVEVFTGNAPENWAQSAITSLDLVSFTTDVNAAKIKPDKKKSGFKIKVESLPVIMPFYILVKNQPADAETILYNSITGFTLAPEALPDEFIGTDQIENLYEHVEEANDMNWIKNESVYEKLLEKVERISIKLEEKKIQSAKNKLEDFVDYVQEKYEQDKIRKEAKILLRQNANYIKRNL